MEALLGRVARLGAGVAGAAFVGNNFLFNVEGGYRAVVFDRFNGVLPKPLEEGTSIVIPVLQSAYLFDVRAKPRVINSVTGTKDLQHVNISLRVLSRPVEKKLPEIFSKIGIDIDERVLPGVGNEVLKAVVAQYNAEELLSKREQISHQIRMNLIKRASEFHLILDDVSITHLTFSKEFTKAIEQKQVAEQDAERQMYLVQRADQERKAVVIRAEGEAEAAGKISKAVADYGSALIEIRRIDAARDIADILSKSRNITYLPGGQNSGLLLGLTAGQG
eukprot:evm.model.NODE_4407_length_63659_cov_22.504595.5